MSMSVTSLSRAGMGMLSSCITFQLRISPELGEGENGAERCGHQVMFRNLSSSHPCGGIPAILTGCQTKRVSGDQSRQLPHFQMGKQARQRKRLALELTEGPERSSKTNCTTFCFPGGVSVYPQLELRPWPHYHSPGPAQSRRGHQPCPGHWGCWLAQACLPFSLLQSPDSCVQPNQCLAQGSCGHEAPAVWIIMEGQGHVGPQRPGGPEPEKVGLGGKVDGC